MTFEEALESAVTDLDLLTDGSDPESLAEILRRHFAPPPRERGFDLAELEACARTVLHRPAECVQLTGPEAMAIVAHVQAVERYSADATKEIANLVENLQRAKDQLQGQHWVDGNDCFTLQEGEGVQVAMRGPGIYSIEKRYLPK